MAKAKTLVTTKPRFVEPHPANIRPFQDPPKKTSSEIRAIAGKWLDKPARDIIAIAAAGSRPDHTEAEWEALVRMVDDFQRLAGSCLSQ